jgi:prepilin-type processing-associated H-X9-DG protein
MNLDLKLNADICAHAVIGNDAPYPKMPKLSALRFPSAAVLLTEQAFSPSLETFSTTPARNGGYPAVRWGYFPKRHNDRGTLVFCDGHSAIFKWSYVYTANPTPCARKEALNGDIWWNPNRDIP